MTKTVSPEERERRRKISESARASEKRRAYYDRIRGVKRGPDSLETRAAKSASHKADRTDMVRWQAFYDFALRRFTQEAQLAAELKSK